MYMSNTSDFTAVVLKSTLRCVILNVPCPHWPLWLSVHSIGTERQKEEVKLIWLKNAKRDQSWDILNHLCNNARLLQTVVLNHSRHFVHDVNPEIFQFFFSFCNLSESNVGFDQYNHKWQQSQRQGMRKDTGEKQLQAIQPTRRCYSPLKAQPSTSTGHYSLWQQIPKPNLELNRLLNTRNLLIQCENQQKELASVRSLSGSFLLPFWLVAREFSVRETLASPKVFWRPWQNGRFSINVMRPQEWPPSFPHLCHLSLHQLQGIVFT